MKKTAVGLLTLFLFGCAQQPINDKQQVTAPVVKPMTKPLAFAPMVTAAEMQAAAKAQTATAEKKASKIKKQAVVNTDVTTDKITASTASAKLAAVDHKQKATTKKTTKDGMLILGHHEWVLILSGTKHISAYIDPKSATSRIGVKDLVEFERDGDNWVKFHFQAKEYKYPVKSWSKSEDKKRLPVVSLRTKLGDRNDEVVYQLINGGNGVVLGENFMRDIAIQNNQRKYIQPRAK
ncbi:putative ATP-dependent zinc protease [Photobacterium iliopiscarium]|uniref:putative ATP-dependent zinc protease n=1 Tax=Photobacterium iliopiscarium TaxID=56192 RepID=UPI0021593525|nr:RimK/LysX family protein [Photobacterium iliopiscarium]